MTQTQAKTLYESDFALWLDDTIAKLQTHDFGDVDLDNLIEELQSLAGRDRKALFSHLVSLFNHALKWRYANSLDDLGGWAETIAREQGHLIDELEASPSLHPYLIASIPKAYARALYEVRTRYRKTLFPSDNPFPTEIGILLQQRFWENESK